MSAAWRRIEKILKERNPSVLKSLRPAASESAISKAATQIGLKLPKPLLEGLYRVHNGQKPGSENVYDDWEFLSLDSMVKVWKMHRQLFAEGDFKVKTRQSDGRTLKDWWNPAWIPFATDGAGDFLCVDLAPGNKGKVGQIIAYHHDADHLDFVADDFDGFLGLVEQTLVEDRTESDDNEDEYEWDESPSVGDCTELIAQPLKAKVVQEFLTHYALQHERTEEGLHYFDQALGISIQLTKKGKVGSIFLFVEASDSFSAFQGLIADDFSAKASIDKIKKSLGKPDWTGPADQIQKTSLRYDYKEFSIHFSCSAKGIRLITLMAPEMVP